MSLSISSAKVLLEADYPRFLEATEASNGHLPGFVRHELEDYLKCGLLEHGFMRVKCDGCRHEHLVAFSWKRRGFCPSCGARSMVDLAAHLVDHVFPEAPVRQFVLTFPFPLRFLLAAHPGVDRGAGGGIARQFDISGPS